MIGSLLKQYKWLLAALGAISLAALIAFLIRHQAGLNSAHPAPPPPSNDVVSVVPSTATATPASTPSAGGSAIIQGDVSDRDLATSNGDVHIRTGDGLYYDFQVVGEFVALKSVTDGLEVQLRQAPWRETSRTISTNIAAAMNVAGDRVGVYTRRNDRLYINGRPTTVDGPRMTLPKGGEVDVNGDEITIIWPDLTEVKIDVVGDYLNLSVDLAPQRAGKVVGLFGNFDRNLTNDMAVRGGGQIAVWDPATGKPIPVDVRNQLYRIYGNSWRIRQSESLFDYDPGQSTATWTDLNFPYAPLSLSAAARSHALAVCKQAGITDDRLLANCILDIAETGDESFAQSALKVQSDLKLRPGFECTVIAGHGSRCTEYAPSLPNSRVGAVFSISVETEDGDRRQVEVFSCSRIDIQHRASCKFRTKGSVFAGAATVSRYMLATGTMHEEKGEMRSE